MNGSFTLKDQVLIVRESLKPDRTVQSVAHEHKVPYQTLVSWRRKYRDGEYGSFDGAPSMSAAMLDGGGSGIALAVPCRLRLFMPVAVDDDDSSSAGDATVHHRGVIEAPVGDFTLRAGADVSAVKFFEALAALQAVAMRDESGRDG